MVSVDLLPYTVLIVECNTADLASTQDVLSTLCFAQVATSVEEARELLGMVPVHVIIAHDTLPDGAGADVCAYAAQVAPDSIRILYGNTPTTESVLTAVNRGRIWRYLTEPWSPREIREIVGQAIDLYDTHAATGNMMQHFKTTNALLERKLEQCTRELVTIHEELHIALSQMHALVATDELTGLSNQRVMMERLTELLKQTVRYKTPLACVLCDIADFKALNAAHGSEWGDSILQEVAARARKHIRDVDLACRAGGDEFLLILPHTNSAQAVVVAERMQRVLSEAAYSVQDQSCTLSIHFGIAEVTSSVANAIELFHRAEAAEYTARATHAMPPIVIYPDPENASPDTVAPNTGRRPT